MQVAIATYIYIIRYLISQKKTLFYVTNVVRISLVFIYIRLLQLNQYVPKSKRPRIKIRVNGNLSKYDIYARKTKRHKMAN